MKPLRIKMKMALTASLIVAGTTVFYACNQVGNGYGLDASGNPAAAKAPDTTLAALVQPIFSLHCIGCHNGTNITGLDLRVGKSYESLLGTGTGQVTNELPTQHPMYRVRPGSSDSSYLYQKVNSTTPKNGVQMPQGGPYLSASDINIIKRWIEKGAPQ